MADGAILITGAGGFIGGTLARHLAETQPKARLVLTDIASHPRIEALSDRATFVKADLTDPAACRQVVTADIGTVFHCAGLVSGGAEKNFDLGYGVNLRATMNMLEACRATGRRPRFVFTSTMATFGGQGMPSVVDDDTFQHPQSSYGAVKVACEQLLNDYSRRGFVDGRGVRLAATVVRDDAHVGLSCATSALVREPVAGRDCVCPLPPELHVPILSVGRTVAMLTTLSRLPEEALGDFRVINGPSIAPSLQEIAEAVRSSGVKGLGKIRFEPDPAAVAIVRTWPSSMLARRAQALGLTPDASIQSIVADYCRNRPN